METIYFKTDADSENLSEFEFELPKEGRKVYLFIDNQGDGYITFMGDRAPIAAYKLFNPEWFSVPKEVQNEWREIIYSFIRERQEAFALKHKDMFDRAMRIDRDRFLKQDEIYSLQKEIRALEEERAILKARIEKLARDANIPKNADLEKILY